MPTVKTSLRFQTLTAAGDRSGLSASRVQNEPRPLPDSHGIALATPASASTSGIIAHVEKMSIIEGNASLL